MNNHSNNINNRSNNNPNKHRWDKKTVKHKIDPTHLELLSELSEEISWNFKDSVNAKKKTFVGNDKIGYFLSEIGSESAEGKKVIELAKKLQGDTLPIEKIFSVYNPTLVANFSSHKILLEEKISDDPNLFKQSWKKNDSDGMRQWVFGKFQEFVKSFSWNAKEEKVPVVAVAHGTGMDIAMKISETGFVALASLDAGFFGQGIYFTSSIPYALPYARLKDEPAIIISYVIPGNIYPVIEDHKSENSLAGAPIKAPGYNSHYVITKTDGRACDNQSEIPVFDELVINQEAQVVPAFILQLNKNSDKLEEFYKKYQREVPVDQ